MRALLDECVPRRRGDELPGHEVRTVPEMGWASHTADQRLSYQQAVSKFSIGVIILIAKRNKLKFLQPLVPELRRALTEVQPGEVRRVGV